MRNNRASVRRRVMSLLVGLLVLVIGSAAAGWWVINQLWDRPQCTLNRPVRVRIPAGASLREVVRILRDAGVVRHPQWLEWYFRWKRTDRRIRAGLYEFRGTLSTRDIHDHLLHGDYIVRVLRFPEGWDRFDVARYLARMGFGSETVILQRMRDPDVVAWIRDLDPEAPDLEGYLFPSTYTFFVDATLDEVLFRMVRTFRQKWRPAWTQRARELGWTVRQVVTLASMIEKETPKRAERPMVSAVFHNRLRRGMRLECDPTVIYAWRLRGIQPVPLQYAHLTIDSPYNTYKYSGLPPGPIANPGLASLRAALYPAAGDWLYFVADGTGGHRFARTYGEHLRNVRRYRQWRRRE